MLHDTLCRFFTPLECHGHEYNVMKSNVNVITIDFSYH